MKTKSAKAQVVTIITTAKKNYKTALYVLATLILLYGAIYIFTRKPQMPPELKATIDSLTNANNALIEHQKQIDSTIAAYKDKVDLIDTQIDVIKNKTTIINKYYTNLNQKVDQFTTTQVDSFFKARYKY